jgi:hypothetical protein
MEPLTKEYALQETIHPANAEQNLQIIVPDQLFTVASPANVNMGMFARLSQATYLLGCVLHHVSDNSADDHTYKEQNMQLERTIRALYNLSNIEYQSRRMAVCPQTAICYK